MGVDNVMILFYCVCNIRFASNKNKNILKNVQFLSLVVWMCHCHCHCLFLCIFLYRKWLSNPCKYFIRERIKLFLNTQWIWKPLVKLFRLAEFHLLFEYILYINALFGSAFCLTDWIKLALAIGIVMQKFSQNWLLQLECFLDFFKTKILCWQQLSINKFSQRHIRNEEIVSYGFCVAMWKHGVNGIAITT